MSVNYQSGTTMNKFIASFLILICCWSQVANSNQLFEFFDALHKHKKNLNTVEKLTQWVEELGLPEASQISATFTSFAVENKLNFAHIMARKYGITGVPAIIVDGRYRTSVGLAGSHEKLIEVINFLIDKAAQERAS